MRRTRVAVIDSGVHVGHPHIGVVAGGVSVSNSGELEEGAYIDRLGHGTAVMAAIQEKAPGAEYFAVKVFDAALRTTVDALLRGIEWSIENGMDVVNLSLGTVNERRVEEFRAVAQRGPLLVSAREAGGRLCYPGSLPGVVGVGLDWECGRNEYREEEGVFYASGYPRPVPGVAPARNLNGISFAVANMTGIIAREGVISRSWAGAAITHS